MKFIELVATEKVGKSHIKALDKNQLDKLLGEIDADSYWRRRNPEWFKIGERNHLSKKQKSLLAKMTRYAKKRQNTGKANDEITDFGSILSRSNGCFCSDAFQYKNLFEPKAELLCVEAEYHAVFVNRAERKLITYCEGDVVTITAPDDATLDQEIQDCVTYFDTL